MEVEYLREFITFAGTLNYAKASERHFLTRSALQSHIKALETEIGVPLVMRYGGGMYLTPAGRELLERAHAIVELEQEAKDACVLCTGRSSVIRVGLVGYRWEEDLLTRALGECKRLHSEINPELHLSPGFNTSVESVLDGSVDVAIYASLRSPELPDTVHDVRFPAEISSEYLGKRKLRFFGSRTEGSPTDVIDPKDLAGRTLVLSNTDHMKRVGAALSRAFERCGLECKIEYCAFPTHMDYFFACTSEDSFGIVLDGHRLANEESSAFQVFDVKGMGPLPVDTYIIIRKDDEQNECSKLYISELLRLAAAEGKADFVGCDKVEVDYRGFGVDSTTGS